MKLLVIKPSSLGDIIHALPTVHLLRRHFQSARISWLINDSFADILTESPVADELILFRRREWGNPTHCGAFLSFLRELRKHRFDLVVDLQGLFRSGFIAVGTGARRRVGLSDAREGSRFFYTERVHVPTPHMHAVDRYLLAAQHLDAGHDPVQFPLGHPIAARDKVDGLLSENGAAHGARLIAVNPCARWISKLWPAENFKTLAVALIERLPDARLVFIGGPQDRESNEAIIAAAKLALGKEAPLLNTAGRTSLSELTELLRRCALLVTNDSGPMHVAAAVDTPVIALFGATDPALTGPYPHGGIHHKVMRSGISCSPCLKPHCHHTPRMECMTRIEPKEVVEAVAETLREHRTIPA